MEFGLNQILSDVSATHLSNLLLPTFMEYQSTNSREIRLIGPNRSFYYRGGQPPVIPFVEVSVLPLTNIQELHLKYGRPIVAPHPSSFLALQTLIINGYGDMSEYLSVFFPNPSFFPSLKTLRFSNCKVTDESMEGLTRFASDRKSTASAWLYCVVIAQFPSVASIRELEKHVPVVDVGSEERYRRPFCTDSHLQ